MPRDFLLQKVQYLVGSHKKTIIMKSLSSEKARLRTYWKTNLRYVALLLSCWFAVSFGAGILFADQLNAYRIGNAKLGFWMAQQGSIYLFVVLIFVYVFLMNRLDKRFDVEE